VLALIVSVGGYWSSRQATRISTEVAENAKEPKISLTDVQLKDGTVPVVTYNLKNFGQAKANALGVVPIVDTPRSHFADQRSAIAEMVLDPLEQVSRTYQFDEEALHGYEYSADAIRNGTIPLNVNFDIAYRDSDDRVMHKCVSYKYVSAAQRFDRDSDCKPMFTDRGNPF